MLHGGFDYIFQSLAAQLCRGTRIIKPYIVTVEKSTERIKKSPETFTISELSLTSGWEDSNFRPLEPHSSTLPNCATPRYSVRSRAFLSPANVTYYSSDFAFCQHLFYGFFTFFRKEDGQKSSRRIKPPAFDWKSRRLVKKGAGRGWFTGLPNFPVRLQGNCPDYGTQFAHEAPWILV